MLMITLVMVFFSTAALANAAFEYCDATIAIEEGLPGSATGECKAMHYYDAGVMLEGTCFLCYAVGVKTFDIVNTHLQPIFEKIVECRIEHASHLLCFYCYRRLQQCSQFCQMAKQAQFLINVFNMVDPTLEVTTDNHLPALSMTKVEYTSVLGEMMQPALDEKLADSDDDDDCERLVIDDEGVNYNKTENDYYSDISSASEDFAPKDLSKIKEGRNAEGNKEECGYVENGNWYDNTEQQLYQNLNTLASVSDNQQVLYNSDPNFNILNSNEDLTHYPIRTTEDCGDNPAQDKFTCDICSRHFNSHSNLVYHKKLTHLDQKSYTCGICQRTFLNNNAMILHRKTHKADKPYSCDVCQRKFGYKNNLSAHKRNHTGYKPYCCEFCEAKFTRKSILTQHRRLHTGEKAFSCNVCDRKYTNKHNLQIHMKKYGHDQQVCDVPKENHKSEYLSSVQSKEDTIEKPFSCPICEKKFTTGFGLKVHSRIHTGDTAFICGICECSFSSYQKLSVHKKTHEANKPEPILEAVITHSTVQCYRRAIEIRSQEINSRATEQRIPNSPFLKEPLPSMVPI